MTLPIHSTGMLAPDLRAYVGEVTDHTAIAPEGYLTMDALLTYCETRLRGLDEQVRAAFAHQKQANATLTGLGDCANGLELCTTGGVSGGGKEAHDMIRGYMHAINCAGGEGTPFGQKIAMEMQAFIDRVGGEHAPQLRDEMSKPGYWDKPLASNADQGITVAISGDEMKGFVARIKNMQSEVNGGTELTMTTLQSLMSQRQMAIQVVTNMIQSLGDMTNKICGNVGH